MDAMDCATVSWTLGAGRAKIGDPVNFAVGLEFKTSVGEKIEKGTDSSFCLVSNNSAN